MAYLTQNVVVNRKTFSLSGSSINGNYTSLTLDCSSHPVNDISVYFSGAFTVTGGNHTPVIEISADGSNWFLPPNQGIGDSFAGQLNGLSSNVSTIMRLNGSTVGSTSSNTGINIPGSKTVIKYIRIRNTNTVTSMTGTINYTILAQ